MANKNYAYRQLCLAPDLADYLPAAPSASVTAGSVVFVATIDETQKPDLDDYMASRAYEYIGELSVMPTKTTHWGAFAAQPVGIGLVINEGDTYYDTTLSLLRTWNGLIWVSL